MAQFQGFVPAANGSGNDSISDVIGNKNDDENGNSIAARGYIAYRHNHSQQKVYPTLAAGVTLTASAAAWALGTLTQIIPVNYVTTIFDIHFANVASASSADIYEVVLYASVTEIARTRVTRALGQNPVAPTPLITPLLPANTNINAKVASSGGGNNIVLSVFYHTY